ncbi:unnamed protein product [Strongylus vulgaris]|uniref:Uncharacterized protein n=1 Tax=Strongylus vulgaris TaxID=40348 RepID=A0A3P7IQV6_STRVU|nr:unnamed protein product [Strongylus vulgaris]
MEFVENNRDDFRESSASPSVGVEFALPTTCGEDGSYNVKAKECSQDIPETLNKQPVDEGNTTTAKQEPPTSSKTLSIPKLHSLIRMRQKLVKHIHQLEVREVCFEDEAKEMFYINHERKLKKALLEVEKTLHKHGALVDVDEDLQAYYDNTYSPNINVVDTGNELLNKRISDLMNKKIFDKEKVITPSFDEIRDIMCELRAEHGSSSGIPDPEKESDAFCE